MMAMRTGSTLAAVVALALLVVQAAHCQGIALVSPGDGEQLRATVSLKATVDRPGVAWVSFLVEPEDGRMKFIGAMQPPFVVDWNTQERDSAGRRIYPDSRYRVIAISYDAGGKVVGQTEVSVTVSNDLDPTDLGSPVLLRAQSRRGQRVSYSMTGRMKVILPASVAQALRGQAAAAGGTGQFPGSAIPGMGMPGMGGMGMPGMGGMGMPGMGGMGMPGMGPGGAMAPMAGAEGAGPAAMGMPQPGIAPRGVPGASDGPSAAPIFRELEIIAGGQWTERTIVPSATGMATVDKRFDEGWYEFLLIPGREPRYLDGVGDTSRMKVGENAVIALMHADTPTFGLGQIFLELPKNPVSVGSRWTGSMTYWPHFGHNRPVEIKAATSTLEAFEYWGKYRCARIKTLFQRNEAPNDLYIGDTPVPASTIMTGVRTSYFAIDAGRFVAVQDVLTRRVSMESQALTSLLSGVVGPQAVTTMGGAGMPGMGGPGMAGMMGGAGMPGMAGGAGMPGMGGPGMAGMMGGAGMPGMAGGAGMPGMGGRGMAGMMGGAGMPGMGGGPGMPGTMRAAGGGRADTAEAEDETAPPVRVRGGRTGVITGGPGRRPEPTAAAPSASAVEFPVEMTLRIEEIAAEGGATRMASR